VHPGGQAPAVAGRGGRGTAPSRAALRSADDGAMAEECCGREVIVGRRRDEIRGGGGREVEAAEAVVHPGTGWVCRQRPRRRSRSRGSNG